MFFDSHSHLHFDSFDSDREEVIQNAFNNGVKYILNIGTDLKTSLQSLEISRTHPTIFTAIGLHPYDVGSFDPDVKNSLLKLAKDEKVVAIGEIGLDYYRAETPRELQVKIFREQIKIALETDLPVIIHTRNAWEDIEKVVDDYVPEKIKGLFHCYSGDLETALRLIKKGFYISFAGNITFKNYKNVDMLQEIPIENMFIETDCPFLSPLRGKRNEPANIPMIAQRLADIKELSVEDIGRITLYNGNKLFGIAPEMDKENVVYKIRNSLYINATNRCSSNCVFCARLKEPIVKGFNLKLTREPSVEETIEQIKTQIDTIDEIVFCGYGEPTIRLDFLKQVAQWVKTKGAKTRLNTNGHGNLINKRDITGDLAGLIDEVNISFNTHDKDHYEKIMRTDFNSNAFGAMLDFMKKCSEKGIRIIASVVGIPGLDIEKCRNLAENSGAIFRVRKYNEVG